MLEKILDDLAYLTMLGLQVFYLRENINSLHSSQAQLSGF
jgi:hypothetical protein